MLDEQEVSKPLALEKAYNVRDLGVYTNESGRKLMERQLLRADGLHSLSANDQRYLKDCGVKAVIDLRSRAEIKEKPNVFCGSNEVDYYSVPLLDKMQSNGMAGDLPKSLSGLYISMLENSQAELAEVLRIVGKYSDKGVVFNCTAGKDRTGMVAMLLLGLAGVNNKTIVIDYAASGKNIEPLFRKKKQQMRDMGIEVPPFVFESFPEEMEVTLEYMRGHFGGVEEYVLGLGLTRGEVKTIQDKMLGQNPEQLSS